MKEEKKLMGELSNLQETENALDSDIKEAEKERESLIKEEERYWKEYSKHRRDCILIDDKQRRYFFFTLKSILFIFISKQ